MLLFSKIYEFYCLYGIEILLSGATGAARQNSYEGLHIFSYKALFTTFSQLFPLFPTFSNFFSILRKKELHMKIYEAPHMNFGELPRSSPGSTRSSPGSAGKHPQRRTASGIAEIS